MADKVRDVMLLTVPSLKDDQDDPIVEPDVLIKDDGWDKHFVKAYLHDEIPWMDMHDEVFDLMCLAAPSLAQLPADQLVFADPEIPEDGMEAGWFAETEAPVAEPEDAEFKVAVESAFMQAVDEAAALAKALDDAAADAEFKAAIDAAVSKAVDEAVVLAMTEEAVAVATEVAEQVTLAVAAPAAQAMIGAPATVGMLRMPEPVLALAHGTVEAIEAPEADEEFDAAVAMAVSKAVEQAVALIRAIDQAPVAEPAAEVPVEVPETIEEVVEALEIPAETEQVSEVETFDIQEPAPAAEEVFEIPDAEEINVIQSVPEASAEALVASDTVTESMPTVRFSFGSQEVRRSGWRVCFSF